MELSIIIPYHNASKYIGAMLDSLLNQQLSKLDYEILIMDDESVDDISILHHYCNEYSNIRYMRIPKCRQGDARNIGIQNAKGKYLWFCDADDKVSDNVVKDIINVAQKNQLDMLFFNRIIINEDENPIMLHRNYDINAVITGKEFYGIYPRLSTGPWHFIISKALVDSYNLTYPKGIHYNEDVFFIYDALCACRRAACVDVDVYYWIQRKSSVSRVHRKEDVIKLCEDTLGLVKKSVTLVAGETESHSLFCRALRNRISNHSFLLLYSACLYTPVSYSIHLINELSSIKVYPFTIGEYYKDARSVIKWLYRLMSIRPIWVMCCCMVAAYRSICTLFQAKKYNPISNP